MEHGIKGLEFGGGVVQELEQEKEGVWEEPASRSPAQTRAHRAAGALTAEGKRLDSDVPVSSNLIIPAVRKDATQSQVATATRHPTLSLY